jgi:hypothetical protein
MKKWKQCVFLHVKISIYLKCQILFIVKPALSLFTTILLTFTCLAQEAPQTQERSKFSISAGAGFGFRTAKVSSSLEGQVYKDEKSMLSGISFFIAPRYQLNNSYSIGVTYRQFSASKSSNYPQNFKTIKLDANQKRNIYYIGPLYTIMTYKIMQN